VLIEARHVPWNREASAGLFLAFGAGLATVRDSIVMANWCAHVSGYSATIP
jgi:hypothetical protein